MFIDWFIDPEIASEKGTLKTISTLKPDLFNYKPLKKCYYYQFFKKFSFSIKHLFNLKNLI